MTQSMQCAKCDNYFGSLQCRAYPLGIPAKILTGEHDHREPYKGDSGIRFEPLKEKPLP